MDSKRIAKELLAVARLLTADVDDVDHDVIDMLKKSRLPIDARSIKKLYDKAAQKADREARKVWQLAKEFGWKGRPVSLGKNPMALDDLWGDIDDMEFERTLGRRHDDAWIEDQQEEAFDEKKQTISDLIEDLEEYTTPLIFLDAALQDLRM